MKFIKKWNRAVSDLLCAESAFTKSVVVSVVTWHVNNGSFFDEWNESKRYSITGTSYYLKYVSWYRTHCSRSYLIFLGKQHIIALCMQHMQLMKSKLYFIVPVLRPQQLSAEPQYFEINAAASIYFVSQQC